MGKKYMKCKTCKRKDKETGECKAFVTKPANCWAWTDDEHWEEKYLADVRRYVKYMNGEMGEYWK